MERDFTPISLLVTGQYVLVVHPSVPAKNAADLIKITRAQPGRLTYGSSGGGSSSQLAAELFKSMAKVDILHVPYKGANDATIATATGEIDMFFASIAPLLPLKATGKVKVLGVTGAKRTPLMPAVPTISESGLPGYERYAWYGLIAPAGLPADIVAKLNAAIRKAGDIAEIKEVFSKQGLDSQTTTPEQFAAFIKNDLAQNTKLVSAAGIKAE
jgi:tripartite-type tricarboxylate transporter receptor subunit TctC